MNKSDKDFVNAVAKWRNPNINQDIEDLIAEINDDLDDIGDTDEFDEDYDWDTGWIASSILLRKQLEIILDGKQREYPE